MSQVDRTEGLVGNTAIKAPVRASTTANITLSGEQTLDGIACVTGDRVLVKNQTNAVNNGIWVVDTGDWNRSQDFDGALDIVTGSIVTVNYGSTKARSLWRVNTENPITIGTTEIVFAENVASSTDASNINYLASGAGSVATTVQEKIRTYKVTTTDYGAVGGGGADTTAVNAAITQVTTNGGVVYFPATTSGLSGIASQITQPNRVRFEGENVRCSGLKARTGFSGSWMVNSVNGVTSMFDAGFENMTLNANDIAGVGCILSDALQENSSLRRVLLTQFRTYGILFQNGYGGASSALIDGCEIFGSSVGAAFSGIFVEQISVVGGFKLTVRDTTITGAPGAQLSRAIAFVNDSSDMSNVHFEEAAVGLYLDGVGHHTIVCMDGATTVTTLVELAATFTGSLTMIGCKRNGSTNFIVDNRSGGIGTITGYDIEHLEIPGILTEPSGIYAPNIHKAYAVFDGTGAGPYVPGTAACPGYFNISSIAKTGTGRWTVTLARPVRNFGAMCPVASTALPNATVTVAPIGVTTFSVGINVGGVATDSNQVFCSVLCN